jgi:uncharacterized membrane protein YbhN (UPF0104 family)
VVLALLARQVHTVDWPRVGQALLAQPRSGLLVAVGLALLSYALFASYDLIGRRETGHGLPVVRTLRIAATCYAFNVNFGSLVGALALKLRLYAREGLQAGTVARVIGLSVLTNWVGYLALGGAVLALAPPPLPAQLPFGPEGARWLGAAMLSASAAYGLLCALHGGRSISVRGHSLDVPRLGVAAWQLAVAAANWALMGGVVWLLLQQRLDYASVLGVLLMAAIAGVVTHVPAGLGVIEAVFLASLGGQLPQEALLAALLAYRATYYLVPLALALPSYAWSERRRSRGGGAAAAGEPAPQREAGPHDCADAVAAPAPSPRSAPAAHVELETRDA